ncbi:MAG: MFS transporter, partial [Chloroflexi bacterium]|nr:MFS transporter [Chloroflexota bacterium]
MSIIRDFVPLKRIADSPRYKWWAFFAISIGLFLTVLDQSGVNIALPQVADYFGADIPTVQWISLSYVLSTSVMLMPLGRLSDIIGRKRVYVAGFVVFVGAAVLAGSAQTFLLIIVAKIIQGAGSAAIQANGMAMITEVFSERERGKALGLYMAIIGTGAISGPIVGGVLVSALGWRAVFFASVPGGLAALVAAMIWLSGRAA